MLSEPNDGDRNETPIPELVIIKDILLNDLRRLHEARMERLEGQLADIVKDVDGKLSALAARIEAIHEESVQSQKGALAEVGEAVSKIAAGLRPGAGLAKNDGS